MAGNEQIQTSREITKQAKQLIGDTLTTMTQGLVPTWVAGLPELDSDISEILVDLQSKQDTFRAAVLAILAFPIVSHARLDLTTREKGDGIRGCGTYIHQILANLKIPQTTANPFDTIGKSSNTWFRPNRPKWDELIHWVSAHDRGRSEVQAAFAHHCSVLAKMARHLPDLPELSIPSLTFSASLAVWEALLNVATGRGAVEQYGLTAILRAQRGADIERERVHITTKHHNAQDRAAGTPGDVQIRSANQVVLEAYEVARNQWWKKLPQAARALADSDLKRITVVAHAAHLQADEIPIELVKANLDPSLDIAVVDVTAHFSVLLASFTRSQRRDSFCEMYDLLERYEQDDLVAALLEALHQGGLVVNHNG